MAALLALASLIGLLGLLLRQPLIVSFIGVGIIAGPSALGLVQSTEHIELLAEIGIAVLLFLVGLKLDVKLVRTLGAVALATGLGQVAFTALFGFFLCLGLGLDAVTSAYVAVALTFSSTIIIVKLLSDKREIDSLHGRIALGFLIVQDLVVVLAMVVLSAYGMSAGGSRSGLGFAEVAGSGILLLGTVGLFIRFGAERLLSRIGTMPELMVTFAVAWAMLLAAVSDWLGFGKELGGLIGGVSLASTSFRETLASRLASLRDFLLLFFFIGLGARLDLANLGDQLGASIVLALFVLVGNPLIVLAIMGYMGYRKRTGFMAGLTVAQISEFSLIFMAMGLSLGHVQPEAEGLVTLVGLVTITLSTYMIVYSQPLYALLEGLLSPFERAVPHREETADATDPGSRYDVILFGLGRYGRGIAKGLHAQGLTVLGVDFDPEAMGLWRKGGLPGVYGDVSDPDFLEALPLRHSGWVVVAIPPHPRTLSHHDFRLSLLQSLRDAGFTGRVALTSTDSADARHMLQAGVDVVLSPFKDAASRGVERIVEALERTSALDGPQVGGRSHTHVTTSPLSRRR
nr:cation:proton antiporter family protein [Azospirillum rugosum]